LPHSRHLRFIAIVGTVVILATVVAAQTATDTVTVVDGFGFQLRSSDDTVRAYAITDSGGEKALDASKQARPCDTSLKGHQPRPWSI